MVNQSLADYIKGCRDQGFTPEQLRETLLTSGWDQAEVDEALASDSPTIQTPEAVTEPLRKTKRPLKRRLLLISGVSLGVILVGLSTSVAMAEQGYLPGFSTIYRKTPLPLLWHGTTGNPSITALQAIQALGKAPVLNDSDSYVLTVSALNSKQKVSLTKLPLLADALQPKTSALADISSSNQPSCTSHGELSVSCDTTATPTQYDPSSSLPVSLKMTTQDSYDAIKGYHFNLSIDLSDVIKKFSSVTDAFPELKPQSTAEATIIRSTNNAYVRSSLIPYLTTADSNKWLRFDVPAQLITYLDNYQKKSATLSSKEISQYQNVLDASIHDQGIIRRDGKPYAKYLVTITPAILRDLSKQAIFADYQIELQQAADDNTTINDTLLLNPTTAQIAFNDATIYTELTDYNVGLSLTVSSIYTYQTSGLIAAPASSQVITDGSDYITKASNQLSDQITGTGDSTTSSASGGSLSTNQIYAMNAVRQSDMTETAKALEIYQTEDSNPDGKVPSTNNQIQNLDTPNNALAVALKDILIIPTDDPYPSLYHYTYQSDGTTYTLMATLTSSTDETVPVSHFVIQDGTTQTIPIIQVKT